MDEAIDMGHKALFFNSGQVCNAGSRVYVHEKIYDRFIEEAMKKAKERKIGDPFDLSSESGPMVCVLIKLKAAMLGNEVLMMVTILNLYNYTPRLMRNNLTKS